MDSEIVALRASDGLQLTIRTIAAMAAKIASLALFIGIATFATGMWVFDGSGQSKWIVIGGLLSFGPAVAATVAAWRIRRTADLAPRFPAEVKRFGTVVSGATDVLVDHDSGQLMGMRAKNLLALRADLEAHRGEFPALAAGVRAITTVPKLVLLATLGLMAAGAVGTVLLVAKLIS
jgi:hypothetical protein